jgi:hypothetical protein
MASRAQVIHDYSFAPPVRQRRAVWLHNDEAVVLPRSRSFSGGGALLVSAAVACALTAGLAYAVYMGDAPPLSATEAAPLQRDFEVDSAFVRANVTNQLSGPAFSVPSRDGVPAMPADSMAAMPLPSGLSGTDGSDSSSASSQETVIDDSRPGVQPAPIQQQLPTIPDVSDAVPRETPYPNPITTPPDAVAPDNAQAAPGVDSENPYRDR